MHAPAASLLPVTGRREAIDAVLPRRREEFDHLLRAAEASAERSPEAQEAREAAADFVAMAFVEPILKQMRETSMAAPPFAPTNGEKQFRAMLDANFAREITRAARFPLIDRLARDLRSAGRTEAEHTHAVRV